MAQASEIRVRGRLLDQAVFSSTATAPHQGVLTMTIQPTHGLAILVVLHVGTEPSAHIAASSKARRLCAGTEVEAHGTGLLPHPSDHGHARFRLMGATEVIAHNHQPQEVDHATD